MPRNNFTNLNAPELPRQPPTPTDPEPFTVRHVTAGSFNSPVACRRVARVSVCVRFNWCAGRPSRGSDTIGPISVRRLSSRLSRVMPNTASYLFDKSKLKTIHRQAPHVRDRGGGQDC